MSNPKKQYTIYFAGTAAFAVPALRALAADERFEVLGVITQPDKPVGRKQVLTPSPVKLTAFDLDLPVDQPERIFDFRFSISEIDFFVVSAYGQIIPKSILNIPKYGSINIHGSLLPKHRGAACVAAAIMAGDETTGVTIMRMDEGLDTGPILKQAELPIEPDDTAGNLTVILSALGAQILPDTLIGLAEGKLSEQTQDNTRATYAPRLTKADGRIDWSKPAVEIERFIRAMQPWPGAWSQLRIDNYELRIKILRAGQPINFEKVHPVGTLFMDAQKLIAHCGDGDLPIERLQLEGKKEQTATDFINGLKAKLPATLS